MLKRVLDLSVFSHKDLYNRVLQLLLSLLQVIGKNGDQHLGFTNEEMVWTKVQALLDVCCLDEKTLLVFAGLVSTALSWWQPRDVNFFLDLTPTTMRRFSLRISMSGWYCETFERAVVHLLDQLSRLLASQWDQVGTKRIYALLRAFDTSQFARQTLYEKLFALSNGVGHLLDLVVCAATTNTDQDEAIKWGHALL